jgi:hypothetical protein
MILPLNLNEAIETRVFHQEAALARGGVTKAPRFSISEAVIYVAIATVNVLAIVMPPSDDIFCQTIWGSHGLVG